MKNVYMIIVKKDNIPDPQDHGEKDKLSNVYTQVHDHSEKTNYLKVSRFMEKMTNYPKVYREKTT